MSEEPTQPILTINSQYIKDLSFEIPHAPEIFAKIQTQPKINVDVRVETQKLAEDSYNVDLSLVLNGDIENEKFFVLELVYSAAVVLKATPEQIEPILRIEVARMIFPFARNIVTQVMMEGGLPPLMLTPIDFVSVYEAHKKRESENN